MPENRPPCPNASELADFHEGRVTAEVAQRIVRHGESCEACRAELAELASDQGFSAELRRLLPGGPDGSSAPRSTERESSPEYETLVELLRESSEGERYEILGELGQGGMGVVWKVRDRVLQRKLAMKVARPESRRVAEDTSPSERRLMRFLEEVRITAQLDHPSIIPVHELGVDRDGCAFFTMREIRGRDLRAVFEEYERGEGNWSLQRLIGVLERACDPVAYAHSKRVVHRDLKPANIMVGRFNAVYVIDWGVAKVVLAGARPSRASAPESPMEDSTVSTLRERREARDESNSTPMTLAGDVVGTPAYMAPEQARGRTEEVGFEADVYSMGAILYRILSGTEPHSERGQVASPQECWQRVLDHDPAPLAGLAPKAQPELIAICERAMARKPTERYPDILSMAADLRAWLEGRVVHAHKTGVIVELRKWVGRNRALAGSSLVFLLALASIPFWLLQQSRALAHGATTLAFHEQLDKKPAEALRLAIEVSEFEENYASRTAVLSALHSLAHDATLDQRGGKWSWPWWLAGSLRAWSPDGEQFVYLEPQAEGEPTKIRLWNAKARCLEGSSIDGPHSGICILHPDGRQVATAGKDGSVCLHDLDTGASRSLEGPNGRAHSEFVSNLAFDAEGRRLASSSWDGTVRLWNVANGELEHSLEGHTGIVHAIEFDAGGQRLLSASGPPPGIDYTSDHTARVWDVASGRCLLVFEGHEDNVTSARFHDTRDLILSTSYDHTAQLWNARDGEVRGQWTFPGVVWDGAFSPDGAALALAYDSGIELREIGAGNPVSLGKFEAHAGRAVNQVEFSPDGKRLLSCGYDGVARIWSIDSGRRPKLMRRLQQHGPAAYGSWSPDGSQIACAARNFTRIWNTEGNAIADAVRPTESVALRSRFHPAGDRVLLAFKNQPAHEYLFAPGEGLHSPPSVLGDAPARDVAICASGAWTLVAQADGLVRLWHRDSSGASRDTGALELNATSLLPALTCDLVGVILAEGGAAVLDCGGRPQVSARFPGTETVNVIRFSEDGQRVALGTQAGQLRVFDLSTNGSLLMEEQLAPYSPTQIEILDVHFYAQGRRVVSVGPDHGAKIWDVDGGGELAHIKGDFGRTMGGVLVIRDGQQVLVHDRWGPWLRMVELAGDFEGAVGKSRRYGSHDSSITDWALREAPMRLLTTSFDNSAIVWDLERGEPWVAFTGHDAPVLTGDLSPDGAWAVTADSSGRVIVWPTDPLAWAERAEPAQSRPKPR